MNRMEQKDLQEVVNRRRLKLAGHVIRKPVRRPARQTLEWKPLNLWRGRGRPKKTWRSTLTEDLGAANLNFEEAIERAQDRKKKKEFSLTKVFEGTKVELRRIWDPSLTHQSNKNKEHLSTYVNSMCTVKTQRKNKKWFEITSDVRQRSVNCDLFC